MRLVKVTTRGPFGDRMMGKSKSGHMLMMELPHFVDRAISMRIEARQIGDTKVPDSGDELI